MKYPTCTLHLQYNIFTRLHTCFYTKVTPHRIFMFQANLSEPCRKQTYTAKMITTLEENRKLSVIIIIFFLEITWFRTWITKKVVPSSDHSHSSYEKIVSFNKDQTPISSVSIFWLLCMSCNKGVLCRMPITLRHRSAFQLLRWGHVSLSILDYSVTKETDKKFLVLANVISILPGR